MDARDRSHAALALSLAALGPAADPNPRVGCVVTDRDGAVAGTGFHRGAGTAHAEVAALHQAADAERSPAGGTAYVTLEPCNHTGRTGPCTQALIEAGVARVVVLHGDPGEESSGGADALRSAGIAVELVDAADALARDAAQLVHRWECAVRQGRPFVTWKFAATLDGYSAAADGTSQWITGAEARADVHRLRAEAGAVVIGTGTALQDDPRLTVRDADGRQTGPQPLRVVVGTSELPPHLRVLRAEGQAAPALVLRTHDPAEVLAELHARDIRHVWLEGGPTVAAAFVGAGLVDEVVAYLAPALLGAGRAAVGDLGVTTLTDIHRFTLADVCSVGQDVRVTLRRGTHPYEKG